MDPITRIKVPSPTGASYRWSRDMTFEECLEFQKRPISQRAAILDSIKEETWEAELFFKCVATYKESGDTGDHHLTLPDGRIMTIGCSGGLGQWYADITPFDVSELEEIE